MFLEYLLRFFSVGQGFSLRPFGLTCWCGSHLVGVTGDYITLSTYAYPSSLSLPIGCPDLYSNQIRSNWRPSSNFIRGMVCIPCGLVALHKHSSVVGLRESEARSSAMQGASESCRNFQYPLDTINRYHQPNPGHVNTAHIMAR